MLLWINIYIYIYITNPEFNKFSAEVFDARLKQGNLVTNTDFDNNISSLNNKIEENKTVNVSFNNLLKNLRKKHDLNYFIGKSHFEEDGTQNYLVFQPLNKYFKIIAKHI